MKCLEVYTQAPAPGILSGSLAQTGMLPGGVRGKFIRALICFTALSFAALVAAATSTSTIQLLRTIPAPGANGLVQFDINWVDENARVYLLADTINAGVDLFDLNTGF